MKARIILITCLAIAVIVSILTIAGSSEDTRIIKSQAGTIANLEELVERKDFAWATADMEVDNLEMVALSQASMVREATIEYTNYTLVKEQLEYSLTWIYYIDELLHQKGISHLEFLFDLVLTDEFFEDIEDQVEWFEGLAE